MTQNRQLLERYDQFFGKSCSTRLLEAKKVFSRNQFIRVNLSKTTISQIEDFLKKNRVKYSKTFLPNAIKIEKSFFNISSSIEALTGKIYIQDLASQIPVNTINFEKLKTKKFIKILDMASSPGSKTTQIADLLNFHKINYELIALEPENKRLTKLINNIQKQGFENIKIFNVRGEDFETNDKFDIILLDSPCSGNLIDDPKWLEKRDLKGIQMMAELQKKLLKKAQNLLKDGGELIYSTCSLEPEENEQNVDWILKNSKLKTINSNLKTPFKTTSLIKIGNKTLDKSIMNSMRFMPYESKTQGFFVTKFEK